MWLNRRQHIAEIFAVIVCNMDIPVVRVSRSPCFFHVELCNQNLQAQAPDLLDKLARLLACQRLRRVKMRFHPDGLHWSSSMNQPLKPTDHSLAIQFSVRGSLLHMVHIHHTQRIWVSVLCRIKCDVEVFRTQQVHPHAGV